MSILCVQEVLSNFQDFLDDQYVCFIATIFRGLSLSGAYKEFQLGLLGFIPGMRIQHFFYLDPDPDPAQLK